MRVWRLDAPGQTLVFAADDGLPSVVYWGPTLPQTGVDERMHVTDGMQAAMPELLHIAQAHALDVTGGMLDAVPPLSLCPEARLSFPGQPGLIAWHEGAPMMPRFALESVHTRSLEVPNANGLHFDLVSDQSVALSYTFLPMGEVISAYAVLRAQPGTQVHHLAAPVLPAPQSGDILHFSGRWIGEFQPQRSPWQPGILKREARTGRSGHEHPPLAFLLEDGATNTRGTVYGMHYAYPGGHVMLAEELPDGRRQIQWGHATASRAAGETFETAPLLLSVSTQGLNGCATAFQRTLRDHVVMWPKPDRPRPVHYNCWEAVYFDHDLDTLKDIAARAADLGAERFVLDDGWFGKRDDDTSSLGDWEVDTRKWPDGLSPLIDHVRDLGMSFGLWVEPEMVNLDSDLARNHPDWILGPNDQIEGRQQRVLDLAREDVRLWLFDRLNALLSTYEIDYLKWDHNRLLPAPDAAQALGTLQLLAQLQRAHPGVEIESCASGGGRIDAGILNFTQRVWLSDSNDALERLCIQHEAALFLPAAVTGSHVGPRRCHTSGRQHDIRFRAWVAAQRHMGFEMDPRELTEDEANVLRDVTGWWKETRSWRMRADILRLDSHDPAVIAELQLSEDGTRFVIFAGRAAASAQIAPRPLRLTGLAPDARYRITLRNRAEAPRLSRGAPILKTESLELSGQYLMQAGVSLPWSFPETLWVIEGERL